MILCSKGRVKKSDGEKGNSVPGTHPGYNNFSFLHCPNYLSPTPHPNSGNLVFFFPDLWRNKVLMMIMMVAMVDMVIMIMVLQKNDQQAYKYYDFWVNNYLFYGLLFGEKGDYPPSPLFRAMLQRKHSSWGSRCSPRKKELIKKELDFVALNIFFFWIPISQYVLSMPRMLRLSECHISIDKCQKFDPPRLPIWLSALLFLL